MGMKLINGLKDGYDWNVGCMLYEPKSDESPVCLSTILLYISTVDRDTVKETNIR